MNTAEFSNEFDILYNNIASNQAPGLDEYEKSVFLTKAQKQIVRSYFEGMLNKSMKGFDASQKRQYDFSTLIRNVNLPCYSQLQQNSVIAESLNENIEPFDSRSYIYLTPVDLFLTINESLVDSSGRRFSILPIDFSEYSRLMLKPYGFPLKRQAWRLITQRQSTINGIGYTQYTSDDVYKMLVFKNIYDKPVNINFIPRTENATVDTSVLTNVFNEIFSIDETSNAVNLNINYGFIIYKQDTSTVFQSVLFQILKTYLMNPTILKTLGYDKYIIPIYMDDSTPNDTENPENKIKVTVKCGAGILPNKKNVSTPVFEMIGVFKNNEEMPVPIYNLRYVKTPRPIILVDNLQEINEGLSIDGYHERSECELPEEIHEEILQRAVELAKSAYLGDLNSEIALGQNSGTNMGVVSTGQK